MAPKVGPRSMRNRNETLQLSNLSKFRLIPYSPPPGLKGTRDITRAFYRGAFYKGSSQSNRGNLLESHSIDLILPAESSTAQLKLFRPLQWIYLNSLILLHGDAYPLRSLRLHHHPHHYLHPYQFRFHSSLRNRGTPGMGLGHLVSPPLP